MVWHTAGKVPRAAAFRERATLSGYRLDTVFRT
jgi:hypothetical protein